jgi:hypothetical protein
MSTIKNYLSLIHPTEKFYLSESKNLSLHWADWNLSRDFVMKKRKEFITVEIDQKLLMLKNTRVYLRSQNKESDTSMYELYRFFLDTKVRYVWFEKTNDLYFSFKQSGPYQSFKAMRWLDEELLSIVAQEKLLVSRIPERKFRLRSGLWATCKCDDIPEKTKPVAIEQITPEGLLIKVPVGQFLDKIFSSSVMKLRLDTEALSRATEYPEHELEHFKFRYSTNDDPGTFFVNLEKLKNINDDALVRMARNGGHYLFVPFNLTESIRWNHRLENIVKPFLYTVEKKLEEELGNVA